jgi:hypothetical protein
MTLTGVGSGTIVGISGGDHNIVGGCTLRNSVGTAVSVGGGHHNTVIGNDIYDVGVHIATNGKKMHLFCAMLCQTLSFYQDRLRTNIGKEHSKSLRQATVAMRIYRNSVRARVCFEESFLFLSLKPVLTNDRVSQQNHDLIRPLVRSGLTSNLISNNHMTQVYLSGKWGPNLRGQGDRFSHNLLHDSPGQLITTVSQENRS